MPFRAFVAVDFAPSHALEELTRDLNACQASLRLVSLEQVHLTLKFLGETEEGLVPEIIGAVRNSCRGIAPFRAHLRGTGAFPNLNRMNVVWIGLEGAAPLGRIAGSLDASLVPLGFQPEGRQWSPHVTIGRIKGGRNLECVRRVLAAHAQDDFGECPVDRVRLKSSNLTPEGPVYATVGEIPL